MTEENRQKERNQSDDSANERKASRSHVAAKLAMTRQREERLHMQRGGKDSGRPRMDELHAEKLKEQRGGGRREKSKGGECRAKMISTEVVSHILCYSVNNSGVKVTWTPSRTWLFCGVELHCCSEDVNNISMSAQLFMPQGRRQHAFWVRMKWWDFGCQGLTVKVTMTWFYLKGICVSVDSCASDWVFTVWQRSTTTLG